MARDRDKSKNVPPSDEVRLEAEKKAQEKAEAQLLAINQAEYDERVAAAKKFDWDAWEKETGLKRPEIG